MQIRIRWSSGEISGLLDDTPTSKKLLAVLPWTGRANTWGNEVYFSVSVEAELEPNAQQIVDPGTICFWTQGSSLAIPFGPTPTSERGECRLVTRVNILGTLEGDRSFEWRYAE